MCGLHVLWTDTTSTITFAGNLTPHDLLLALRVMHAGQTDNLASVSSDSDG